MTETKRQFCVVPSEAVFDKRLSNADLRVVCALAAYADKEGRCWPSLQTVADRLGVSSRYVRTRLKAIERAGHITVVRNAGRSNRYTLGKGWNLGTIGSDQSGTIGSNQDLDPGTPRSYPPGTPGSAPPERQHPPNNNNTTTKNTYAFAGTVIRLTWQDFAKWSEAYHAIPDIRAKLQKRDDWLATLPNKDRRRKDWFLPTSNWLAMENEKAAQNRASRPADDFDSDVIH